MKPLPAPSLKTRLELTEEMKVIRSYVHLLLPRWPKENEKKEIGTAVMLRAGNHLFAATAEHCARQEMTIFFPLGEGQQSYSKIMRKLTRKSIDIAVLELENRPDVLACGIEQVCIDVPKPATTDSDPTPESNPQTRPGEATFFFFDDSGAVKESESIVAEAGLS